jgi:hypothetical protein
MNKTILGATVLTIAFLSVGLTTHVAFAQYFGNVDQTGKTGKNTLEEALRLQHERVLEAQSNPSTGSGTPYLSADGVLGASAIAGAVFGGIAAAFFFRARSGRYAAQGRG